jgi:hypothetical protein
MIRFIDDDSENDNEIANLSILPGTILPRIGEMVAFDGFVGIVGSIIHVLESEPIIYLYLHVTQRPLA